MDNQEVTKTAEEQAAEAIDKQSDPEVRRDQWGQVIPQAPEPAPGVREVEALQKARPTAEIQVREGMLVPQTLNEATRIAKGLMDSGCLPKSLNSIPKVLMAQQFLRQLGLPDIACLPRIAVINGSYSLWGEGPKAICQADLDDFEEFWFDAEYNKICFDNKNLNAEVFGAYCRVNRKGIATPVVRTFTVEDAKTARLWGKSGPWTEHPRRMLQYRSRSWALKDACPDRMMGLDIAEWDHNTIVDVGEAQVVADQAPKLVERFK